MGALVQIKRNVTSNCSVYSELKAYTGYIVPVVTTELTSLGCSHYRPPWYNYRDWGLYDIWPLKYYFFLKSTSLCCALLLDKNKIR